MRNREQAESTSNFDYDSVINYQLCHPDPDIFPPKVSRSNLS